MAIVEVGRVDGTCDVERCDGLRTVLREFCFISFIIHILLVKLGQDDANAMSTSVLRCLLRIAKSTPEE